MFEPAIIFTIFATFLLAGTVKGVIGLGLPTVSLGLLTAAIDLPTAMALLIVPSFVTNFWQAAIGGGFRDVLNCVWPFLAMATLTVWFGAAALTLLDPAILSGLLGGLLATYAVVSLAGFRLSISNRHQIWAGPVMGTVNGILTGMTGSFVVPGVMYLQAIGLERDRLVQAMGMLFLVSTAALAVSLGGNDLLTPRLGIWSAAALVPALGGMVLGWKVRRHLSEERFRRVFFCGILILGVYILAIAVSEA